MENFLGNYSSSAEANDHHDIYHVYQWYVTVVRRVCQLDKGRSGKHDDYNVSLCLQYMFHQCSEFRLCVCYGISDFYHGRYSGIYQLESR